MPPNTEVLKATQLLLHKLREELTESDLPALGAVLVRDGGATRVSGQLGIRKLGATGAANDIASHDRFYLGSLSKVFTGNLMGKLIQEGIGNLDWDTRLVDVFTDIRDVPGMRPMYADVTIEQLLVHASGMPYQPKGDPADAYLSWTAADLTREKLMERRRAYVRRAVVVGDDEGPSTPGTAKVYGGGGVICAAMAEKRTGKTYEELIQQHVLAPLGMQQTAWGDLGDVYLHVYDDTARKLVPQTASKKAAWKWHPRNPVGGACGSAGDLGRFLAEQIRPQPQVWSAATRHTMQTHQVTPASGFVRGAWSSSAPGSDEATIAHDGGAGASYAYFEVALADGVAYGAICNADDTLCGPAFSDVFDAMRLIHSSWGALFTGATPKQWPCVHPMPAVALAGSKLMAFARRHDGTVHRFRSANGGEDWTEAGPFTGGILTSGLAADCSADGKRILVFGRGTDDRIWFTRSTNAGASWEGWKPIRTGVFRSGPAACVAANGGIVHAFATGLDRRIYRSRSIDGGNTWIDWEPIGQGVFTSAPAAAASDDGKIVHVLGRGTDWRVWRNVSQHSGSGWRSSWTPIGKGVFTSGPAAAASADGRRLHVAARGTNRALWRNVTADAGATWLANWREVPAGAFSAAPCLVTAGLGRDLQLFALGGDFRIWRSRSLNGGDTWGAWEPLGTTFFV